MLTKTEKIIELSNADAELKNSEIAEIIGCSKRLVRMVRNTPNVFQKKQPKILVFDIETSPMEVYVWGLYKQRIPIDNVKKEWSILSWSAKWLFDDKIMSMGVTGTEAKNREDSRILHKLWNLIDEADILIGHNAQSFDVRKCNFRFAVNGFQPPMPCRVIDTYRHGKKVFNSASYKMDYLNKVFGNDAKLEAPYEWWVKSVEGSTKHVEKIRKYNEFDIVVTEELYVTMRPWIKGHVNLALYIDTDKTVCTNCMNDSLQWGGYYYTPAGRFKAFRCNRCGSIGRSRFSDLTKEERANMLLSVAS